MRFEARHISAMDRLASLALISLLAGCTIPDKLCDSVAKDNTCDSNADCVKAYCAVDCDHCEKVYSRKQADRAYCLIIVGGEVPDRCREAYEDLGCDGGLPPICPEEAAEARCVDHDCVPVMP